MINRVRCWISIAICTLLLWVGNVGTIVPPAYAAILTQEETPGQILYQSRHRLRDEGGNTWQTILYKRVKNGESSSLTLRLVGFPGTVEIVHPASMEITTSDGQTIAADDRFVEASPAPNVGEYDMEGAIEKFSHTGSVSLSLKTIDRSLDLQIPFAVVVEWQDLWQH